MVAHGLKHVRGVYSWPTSTNASLLAGWSAPVSVPPALFLFTCDSSNLGLVFISALEFGHFYVPVEVDLSVFAITLSNYYSIYKRTNICLSFMIARFFFVFPSSKYLPRNRPVQDM